MIFTFIVRMHGKGVVKFMKGLRKCTYGSGLCSFIFPHFGLLKKKNIDCSWLRLGQFPLIIVLDHENDY
jgi:hypothetical protein